METKEFRINPIFATRSNLPAYLTATIVLETTKAMYLYGHGKRDPQGLCARCGRTLTHPGSILIGIGPECLKDWGARDNRLDNLSKSDIARLEALITFQKVDGWFPKSCIKGSVETAEKIEVPADHPKLAPKTNLPSAKKAVSFSQGTNTLVKITFPFSTQTLNEVKALKGRKFHNEGAVKYWSCPPLRTNIEELQKFGFELSPELLPLLNPAVSKIFTKIKDIPGLKMPLFAFQKDGVNFIEDRGGKALIADEMGLGKTAQALSWLQYHPEKKPVIIVVPGSLKLNWEKEAKMWMSNPKIQILFGRTPGKLTGEIIILNYDILPNQYEKYIDNFGKKKERELPHTGWVDFLIDMNPQVLILDEAHYIKSNTAHRTKAVKKLSKAAGHLLALTGSPIMNRPIEIYNVLRLLGGIEMNKFSFGRRYCAAYNNGFGWDFNGSSNKEELHDILTNGVMIRRKKEDVLKDLPDKIHSFTPLEMKSRKEYLKAETSFLSWMRENRGDDAAQKASQAEVLTQIEVLKQISVSQKLPAAIEWIENFLETDNKLVVFATHKFVVDALMEKFGKKAVKIDGSTPSKTRQEIVEKFQDDPEVRLFIGNIKAAGVGLTLTAASTVAFLELPWAPMEVSQAEDRCHRIGQKDTVNVHYLLTQNTIEEKIALMLDEKRKIVDATLDGKETVDGNLLNELIKSYLVEGETK